MEKICTALCEIDKAIEATTYLAVGGIALTLAIFLSSAIAQIEFTHRVGSANNLHPNNDEMHNLAQRKRALSGILFTWWLSLAGFVLALGIDIPNVVQSIDKNDLAIHAGVFQEFLTSDVKTKIDIGGSMLIMGISALSLSFSVWLMFPENRNILQIKR